MLEISNILFTPYPLFVIAVLLESLVEDEKTDQDSIFNMNKNNCLDLWLCLGLVLFLLSTDY